MNKKIMQQYHNMSHNINFLKQQKNNHDTDF